MTKGISLHGHDLDLQWCLKRLDQLVDLLFCMAIHRKLLLILGTLLIAACGAEDSAGPLATLTTPTTENTSAPGPTSSSEVEPAATAPQAENDELGERVAQFSQHLRAGTLPVEWVTDACRERIGLASMPDALATMVLAKYAQPEGQADFTIRRGVPAVDQAVVTFDEDPELPVSQVWVETDGQWQIDGCAYDFDPFGAGVPLLGDSSQSGFVARVTSIADALESGDVGLYQWLSPRCRVAMVEEMEAYAIALLYAENSSVFVDLTGVEVRKIEGQYGFTSPISDWEVLTSGQDSVRWIYANGNWFYDGCPTAAEATERATSQIETLLAVHAPLVDLQIPGMTSKGFSDTDINGPLERIYTFELISQTQSWPAVQREFIEGLWPELLDDAGYEILKARGQTVHAVQRDDPMGKVDVRMESASIDNEHERHTFWLTLRYR